LQGQYEAAFLNEQPTSDPNYDERKWVESSLTRINLKRISYYRAYRDTTREPRHLIVLKIKPAQRKWELSQTLPAQEKFLAGIKMA